MEVSPFLIVQVSCLLLLGLVFYAQGATASPGKTYEDIPPIFGPGSGGGGGGGVVVGPQSSCTYPRALSIFNANASIQPLGYLSTYDFRLNTQTYASLMSEGKEYMAVPIISIVNVYANINPSLYGTAEPVVPGQIPQVFLLFTNCTGTGVTFTADAQIGILNDGQMGVYVGRSKSLQFAPTSQTNGGGGGGGGAGSGSGGPTTATGGNTRPQTDTYMLNGQLVCLKDPSPDTYFIPDVQYIDPGVTWLDVDNRAEDGTFANDPALNYGDRSPAGMSSNYGIGFLNFDGQTDDGLLQLTRTSNTSVLIQAYPDTTQTLKVPRSLPNVLYQRITDTRGFINMGSAAIEDKYWRIRGGGTLRWIVLINCSGKTLYFWGSGSSNSDMSSNFQMFTVPNQQTLYFVGTFRSLTYSEFKDFTFRGGNGISWSAYASRPFISVTMNDPLYQELPSVQPKAVYRMTAENSITPATSAWYAANVPALPAQFPYRTIELGANGDYFFATNEGFRLDPKPHPVNGANQTVAGMKVYRIVGASDVPFNYKSISGLTNGYIVNDMWTLKKEKLVSFDAWEPDVYYAAFMNLTGMPLTFTVESETRTLARDAFGFYVGPRYNIVFAPV